MAITCSKLPQGEARRDGRRSKKGRVGCGQRGRKQREAVGWQGMGVGGGDGGREVTREDLKGSKQSLGSRSRKLEIADKFVMRTMNKLERPLHARQLHHPPPRASRALNQAPEFSSSSPSASPAFHPSLSLHPPLSLSLCF
eukprot:764814-Hanusia_phi.AAC.2